MGEPIWIDARVVYAIQLRQLAEHGGERGVRDPGLLESALARPRNRWAYGDPTPDLPALAGSYAYGVVRNHPFLDANKRTALVTCLTFLRLNGHDLSCREDETYEAFWKLAAGSMAEEEFAAWMRERLGTWAGETGGGG